MVRRARLQCVPPNAELAALKADHSQAFFTPDAALDVGDNLWESYQRLRALLKDPPCLAGTDKIDVFFLRMAVKEVLHYHESRYAVWYQHWSTLYKDPNYSYQLEDGTMRNYLFDLDADGVYDGLSPEEKADGKIADAFPMDERYSADGDGDRVPDRIDLYPDDPAQFISPQDVKNVVFENGRPVFLIDVYMRRDPDSLSERKFRKTLERWSQEINPYIDANMSDRSVGWRVRLIEGENGWNTVTVFGYRPPYFDELKGPDFLVSATQFDWPYSISKNTVQHELGHHLGLEDRYKEDENTNPDQDHVMQYLQKKCLVKPDDFMSAYGTGKIYAEDVKMAIAQTATWPTFLAEADNLKQEGNIKEAWERYQQVLLLNPRHPQALKNSEEIEQILVKPIEEKLARLAERPSNAQVKENFEKEMPWFRYRINILPLKLQTKIAKQVEDTWRILQQHRYAYYLEKMESPLEYWGEAVVLSREIGFKAAKLQQRLLANLRDKVSQPGFFDFAMDGGIQVEQASCDKSCQNINMTFVDASEDVPNWARRRYKFNFAQLESVDDLWHQTRFVDFAFKSPSGRRVPHFVTRLLYEGSFEEGNFTPGFEFGIAAIDELKGGNGGGEYSISLNTVKEVRLSASHIDPLNVDWSFVYGVGAKLGGETLANPFALVGVAWTPWRGFTVGPRLHLDYDISDRAFVGGATVFAGWIF